LDGLGKLTSKGSALLIMGVIGGGVAPLLYGAISDAINPQVAYGILIPFYVFILYYSVSGYKAGKVLKAK
jgi:fucose permease